MLALYFNRWRMTTLKGQLNQYVCDTCKGDIVTIDKDDGCTPFMLACRATKGCKGMMQSRFYRGVCGVPAFEWRKPTFKEFRKASRAMQDHFEQGGLDIYPVTTNTSEAKLHVDVLLLPSDALAPNV